MQLFQNAKKVLSLDQYLQVNVLLELLTSFYPSANKLKPSNTKHVRLWLCERKEQHVCNLVCYWGWQWWCYGNYCKLLKGLLTRKKPWPRNGISQSQNNVYLLEKFKVEHKGNQHEQHFYRSSRSSKLIIYELRGCFHACICRWHIYVCIRTQGKPQLHTLELSLNLKMVNKMSRYIPL